MKRTLVLLTLGLFLGGCVNLDAVRQFAGESAKLASYQDLTVHFRDTYTREAPYLSGSNLDLAKANDVKRKEAYKDLVAINDTVSLYMATLAKLAGDKTFDLSQGIDSVSKQINAHPEFGIEGKHVDALANIFKLVSKWALVGYQQDAVRVMIRDGEAPIQTSLDGMLSLLRLYKKTNDNERKQVLGLFETEFEIARIQPKDPLLVALARVHYRDKFADYASFDKRLETASKAIEHIAKGHTKLYEGLDNFSASELKATLTAITKDMKQLREQLLVLQ